VALTGLSLSAKVGRPATGRQCDAKAEIKTFWQVSGPPALAFWGDPLVGRILLLLLEDSGYEVRFLPAPSSSSLMEPGVMRGIQLLVLAPTPQVSTGQREVLLAMLEDTLEAAEMPVLELVTVPDEGRRAAAQGGPWQMVPWPCRIKELERRIEAALAANPEQLGPFSRH
jgi:hypothetical protein